MKHKNSKEGERIISVLVRELWGENAWGTIKITLEKKKGSERSCAASVGAQKCARSEKKSG